MVRVYPREIRKFIPDFGSPQNWTAIHWEIVALHIEEIRQLLVRNRSTLLALLQSKDKNLRQGIEDEEARHAKEIKGLNSEIGRRTALIRHENGIGIKAWVRDQWVAEKSAYEGNKSAFARDYSRRLMNEKTFKVEASTIATRWLKGI